MFLFLLKWAIMCSVIAAVYIKILAFEPILNWWFMLGARYEKRWFYRPVWGCEKCFAGQLCFWSLVFYFPGSILRLFKGLFSAGWYQYLTLLVFCALCVLFAVSAAILLTVALAKLIDRHLN